MYRVVARMIRGDVACLVAGAGVLAFVVTTNAEKLIHDSAPAGTRETIRAAANADGSGTSTDRGRRPDLRLAIPRPPTPIGGSAQGAIAGGDPGTSQEAGFEVAEGFMLGHLDGQVEWNTFASSKAEAHIEDANPATGDQHVRIGRDPVLADAANVGAFSPNMGIFTGVSAKVTVDIFITGTGRDYEFQPQSPTEDLVTLTVLFEDGGVISVLDNPGAVFVDTGFMWIPDQYVTLNIDFDVVADTITYFYNGEMIYTMAVEFGTAVQETVILGNNGAAGSGHMDFDNYTVVGDIAPTGACCNFDGMSGCEALTADDCATATGTYLGNDTDCAVCPMGACCNLPDPDGCVVMTPEQCAGIADAFYIGDDEICADCPPVPEVCGPGAGECLIAHVGPGCDDVGCCALVCDDLPLCCILDWDQNCADAAIDTFCIPPPACGVAGTGDCFVANGDVFCEDICGVDPCEGCCELICNLDPFCCETTWDGICANEAVLNCNCAKEDVPGNNDCIDATEVFVGLKVEVTNLCATPDGPKHATCNDGFVVGLGNDVWFIYNAVASGTLTITPTPLDIVLWETQMAVYQGSDCKALSDPPLLCAPKGGVGVLKGTSAGRSYLIRLGGQDDGPGGVGTLLLELSGAACPWDCESTPEGTVGINDFLELLSQWNQVGSSCDFDGGGVGINAFLDLLAHWGPCP